MKREQIKINFFEDVFSKSTMLYTFDGIFKNSILMFFGGHIIFKYSIDRGSIYYNFRVIHPLLKKRGLLHTEQSAEIALTQAIEKIFLLKDLNVWTMRNNDKYYKKIYEIG